MCEKDDEIARWEKSTNFWRLRSNAFEIALRQIVAVSEPDAETRAERRWEIAEKALTDAKR